MEYTSTIISDTIIPDIVSRYTIVPRLGLDRYGYDSREHRNAPGVGGITQLK
jgi:hypothetical protein